MTNFPTGVPPVELPRRLLRSVEKPARYVGGEWNQVRKDNRDGALTRFAFCFPDVYEIGMSHLGLRILYGLLNDREDTACERAFAPWPDMAEALRREGIPLFSLESRTPLSAFDFVGFTLQYEMSYTNVLLMLRLAGIPLSAAERGLRDPLVIGGGPCAVNPEPMADCFDLLVLGEGEEVLGELLDLYGAWRRAGRGAFQAVLSDGTPVSGEGREGFLLAAARIPGIYVPAFYDVDYLPDGRVASVRPNRPGVPERVLRRVVAHLDRAPLPTRDLVPNLEVVHDRVFLELFRGCTRGCRFCQAGFIYRPVRSRSPGALAAGAREALAATGCGELALLSLSTSDYPALEPLADTLLADMEPRRASLSLPSLRIDSVSLGLLDRASRVRKSGLTFAPEAGTQRLRDVINKGVTEEDLVRAMGQAFAGGWNGVKLYFMLGLPEETDDDVAGIARLARAVETQYRSLPRETRKRPLSLTVSTSVFVPKPHTPFQWEPQIPLAAMKEKQRTLRGLLQGKSLSYQWHEPATSFWEAVLSRGDRRLWPVIRDAFEAGCLFDSWDDRFRLETWLAAMERHGLDPAFYANRVRDPGEVFPWDHLDMGVDKSFLLEENRRAHAGVLTPECRTACSACGAACFGAGVCVGEEAAG